MKAEDKKMGLRRKDGLADDQELKKEIPRRYLERVELEPLASELSDGPKHIKAWLGQVDCNLKPRADTQAQPRGDSRGTL